MGADSLIPYYFKASLKFTQSYQGTVKAEPDHEL